MCKETLIYRDCNAMSSAKAAWHSRSLPLQQQQQQQQHLRWRIRYLLVVLVEVPVEEQQKDFDMMHEAKKGILQIRRTRTRSSTKTNVLHATSWCGSTCEYSLPNKPKTRVCRCKDPQAWRISSRFWRSKPNPGCLKNPDLLTR